MMPMSSDRPDHQHRRGFTLIELLVALAVFSLAALALLNLTGENTRTATHIETLTLGAIVAENRAIEAVIASGPPAPGTETGQDEMAGRRWAWRRTIIQTPQPDLLRIDVLVTQDGHEVGSLTVFRGAE